MSHLSNPLSRLTIAHWPEPDEAPGIDWAMERRVLVVNTCLRRLSIELAPACPEPSGAPEQYVGTEAYRFLLEVLTGLRSRVPGETNVYGQVRRAWLAFRQTGAPAVVAGLAPSMHRALNDAREIRRAHLEGVGGASYGSLLRKLLRPDREARVLFVGTGGLAQSLWPFFGACAIGHWNHRATNDDRALPGRRFAVDEPLMAARWADHVVLTTPPDTRHDQHWAAILKGSRPLSVTHMGHRRTRAFHVPGTTRCYQLDDLFDLRARQANVRSLQVERALQACRERAAALPADTAPGLASLARA